MMEAGTPELSQFRKNTEDYRQSIRFVWVQCSIILLHFGQAQARALRSEPHAHSFLQRITKTVLILLSAFLVMKRVGGQDEQTGSSGREPLGSFIALIKSYFLESRKPGVSGAVRAHRCWLRPQQVSLV